MINQLLPGGDGFDGRHTGASDAISRRRWEEIYSIRLAELGPLFDVGLRYTLIVACTIPLCLATGTWLYLAWAMAYLTCNTCYLILLHRLTPPVSALEYNTFLALNLTGNVLFASLPLYLWYVETGFAIRTMAVCALVGHIMFNLTRRKIVSFTAYVDMVIIVITILAMAAQVMWFITGGAERALVFIGAFAVASYYIQAHLGSIREHADLLRVRREAIAAQRDNATGQLTAGIAHDFNNILTAVQGNIQLAELSTSSAETKELLTEALNSTTRASNIVAQLTAYVGKSQLSAKQLQVRDVFDGIEAQLKAVLPPSVHFTLRQPSADLCVQADQSKLETALINLAENSAEALRITGGRISLSAMAAEPAECVHHGLDGNRSYAVFRMRDNGPGMDPVLLARATEPFFSTKPKATGSGLGLSMVKGFAKQSNGVLALKNHPEGGFEASLILPICERTDPGLD